MIRFPFIFKKLALFTLPCIGLWAVSIAQQPEKADASQTAIASSQDSAYFYQAHRGLNHKIYLSWSSNGTDWRDWFQVGNAETLTFSAPALAMFNNQAAIMHRGLDNRIYFAFWNGEKWKDWVRLDGPNKDAATPSAPAMISNNNGLIAAHRGFDNGIYLASTSNRIDWSGWTRLLGSDVTTPNTPAMVVFQKTVYITYRGFDNRIYITNWNGSTWQKPMPLVHGDIRTQSAPAVTVFKERLFVAHRGMDDRIYVTSFDGRSWNQVSRYGDDAFTPSSPAIAVFKEKLYLTRQTLDNRAMLTTSSDGVRWSNEVQTKYAFTPLDADGTQVPASPTNIAPFGVADFCLFGGYCERGSAYSAHSGVDYAIDSPANVHAICDGQVVSVASNSLAKTPENSVTIIRHNNCGGYATLYAYYGHIAPSVKKDQLVKKNGLIGTIAYWLKPNKERNDHLHFGLATALYPSGWGYPKIGISTTLICGAEDAKRRNGLEKLGWRNAKSFEESFNWWNLNVPVQKTNKCP